MRCTCLRLAGHRCLPIFWGNSDRRGALTKNLHEQMSIGSEMVIWISSVEPMRNG
jgi:hypothetical protein